jgi:DNA-binding transcriptional MocR family regulator
MAGIFFSAARFARVLEGWSDGPGPVSTRLLVAIREHIRSGQLPAGARLPSERQVAAALGVARTTITHAFDALRGEGLLASRTGVGTFVSTAGRHASARGDDRLGSFVHQRADARIDLRSAALVAIPVVADVLASQCAADFSDTLGTHGYVPAGLPVLRSAVADYYQKLGLATASEQVLVTSGAQQALRLVAQAMIEPGDAVLLEEPTYRGAIEVMRSAGARLIGIPSGERGIDLDALTDTARRHRLKLIVLQSTVHNPTGSVLPENGRAVVAELAARLGVTIVDHLAGMDALIDGPMPKPLAAYGCDVITIGSASKAFWGGLRVGWIRAASNGVGHLTVVKSAEDLGTSIPAQIATAKLLYRIEEAREYRRDTLGAARTLMLKLLADRLGDWEPLVPAGGASMWVRLPHGYSATATVEKAARAGIDVLPGPTFSSENALDSFIRVAFAAPAETLIAGIDGLAAVWHNVRASYPCAV